MNKILLCLLTILLLHSSCVKENAEDLCSAPDEVSYSNHIQPLFSSYCATSGCHSGNNPEGGLNLEPSFSYNELFTPGKGYIDTLNPKYSLLYSAATSKSNPMPPSGLLPACRTNVILRWIEQKAKNN